MIINIRGTSGSGKTTLVRRLLENCSNQQKHYIDGRKQPIGYVYHQTPGEKPLAVIGHYETACGGCDTIQKMEKVFELVRLSHSLGYDVIFEGLLIAADVNRTQALHDDGLPLTVIALSEVPIEVCLSSVNERRMARLGPEKYTPVAEKNTRSKYRGVQTSCVRLVDAGVNVHMTDREGAYSTISHTLWGI